MFRARENMDGYVDAGYYNKYNEIGLIKEAIKKAVDISAYDLAANLILLVDKYEKEKMEIKNNSV